MHHTHWDREWYRSFADFRFRLLRASEYVVSLLEDNSLQVFLFDGQTSVIEDLSTVAGDDLKKKLFQLIRQGRIEVGPWYIMPDEFLVSGESILRNLEIGMVESRQLGSSPEVLYLPDTFGHISQLPAIAWMFGLTSILLARGVNQAVSDLLWTGADGTEIHTHALPLWSGYYQDFLHGDTFLDQTDKFIAECVDYASGAPILLTAGSDHSMPPADWKQRAASLLSHLSRKNPPWELEETSLSLALHEIRSFHKSEGVSEDPVFPGRLEGELRDNGKSYILSGVLSSRVDVKRANVETQDKLSYELEPLGYFATRNMLYHEHRNLLWKTLIQNHAHDSIGGCSIDEVHRENLVRFQQVYSGAARQVKDITRRLAGRKPGVFNDRLVIWNQLPYLRETPVRVEIFIPAGEDLGGFTLLDEAEELEVDILSREKSEGFVSEFEYPVNWYPGWKYIGEFVPRLRGMESRAFRIVPRASGLDRQGGVTPSIRAGVNDGSPAVLENRHLRVEIRPDGTVNLLNKQGPIRIDNALGLLWEKDDGDSYTSSPRPSSSQWGRPVRVRPAVWNRFSSHCSLNFLGPDESEVELLLSLNEDEKMLRLKVSVHNRSRDSRLRLIAGQPGSSRSSISDIPFDVVQREHVLVRPHVHTPQREAYPNEWPSSSYVAAAGVSICHNGFHGYDLLPDGRIALNLLRAVGTLSKADLPERGGGAGPHFETPDAQMQKSIEGEIGIYPGEWDTPVLTALMFRVSLVHDQGMSPAATVGILDLNNNHLILSALYRINDEVCFLRIWNSSETEQEFIPQLPAGSRLRRFSGIPMFNDLSLGGADFPDGTRFPLRMRSKEIAGFILVKKGATV